MRTADTGRCRPWRLLTTFWLVLALAAITFVTYCSLIPPSLLSLAEFGKWSWVPNDKIMHAVAYGFLALLVTTALVQWFGTQQKLWWRIWLYSSLFGVLIELLQLIMETGRQCDIYDMGANSAGALAVCLSMHQFTRKKLATTKREAPQ